MSSFLVYNIYMRKYRDYSDQDIIDISKTVYSIAGLLKAFNLKPAGGNYANIKRLIQRLKIDTSHWTGQGWNNGKQLKDWKDYTRAVRSKPHLIKIRSHTCEICKNSMWLNKLIPLEIHHVDGDRTNNELNNLQLLCCNCHATTDFWRNKKKAVDKTVSTV